MDLETLLPAIRSLQDLPRLVAALGHQPLWGELPDQTAIPVAHDGAKVIVVGRTGELPWLAIESSAPRHDARTFARRASHRGHMSLALALDTSGRRLAVAIGFGDDPVLELELDSPCREALASLGRLAGAGEGGYLAFAARAADALGAETVGIRFFREFRSTLDRMAAEFLGPMQADDRHGLALLQLTRVLFLYFIQTKGWLGGRERFLADEVDGCLRRRRRIHRDLLRPLFFGTLNRPKDERSRAASAWGPIPFLNGGLFEPHPLERRYRIDIPNAFWRDAFDRLFERFHFTVGERGRHGEIAPDMLGRVFEGVMEREARRASGTFYTPASLVSAILDAAMTALVAERLECGDSEAERRLQDRDPRAIRVLASIALLDPAVGSGAFLVGALDHLSKYAAGGNLSARKRWVLQYNLFGVDQSAAAVRLTELRLWLAVIADDPAERAEAVQPLPNLDCLVRQGDSLFDPLGSAIQAMQTPELMKELSSLRRTLVTASGCEKRGLVRRLCALEATALSESLAVAEGRTRAEIADCLDQGRGGNLFGQRRGLDRQLSAELSGLRKALHTIRQARRRLSREREVPWFHYQSHFADVFARGGFDLVVGNPPWLRSEEIPARMRGRLAGRYRWWRTGGRGYGNRPDLAVAFLERAFELAAPGGVVAMLVPAKILSAHYGITARHALASTVTLHVVADLMGDTRAQFEATVYPMALIAGKSVPAAQQRVRTTLNGPNGSEVRQWGLRGGGPWILRGRLASVVEGLLQDHPKLGEQFTCHLGLKTGSNRVFLDPPEDLEPEVLRWALRGRDVRPFRCNPNTRLLWTHDHWGNPRPQLPPRCAAYLKPHLAELRARKDFEGGLPWTVFRARPAVAQHRVVWADLARQLTAVSLTTAADLDHIPLNSCYVTSARSVAEADRLAAWLNSTWLRAAARLRAAPAAGGFARFNAGTVGTLPLPCGVCADPELARLTRAARLGAEVQDELDEVAAGHLNLSSGARRALRAVVEDFAVHRR
ncbi:MAG TPA: N-6 DNA methylase [Gemmatimonadales bacterium]|nr:N-6 DNA methylase [Gemmatimonadales bacterium]